MRTIRIAMRTSPSGKFFRSKAKKQEWFSLCKPAMHELFDIPNAITRIVLVISSKSSNHSYKIKYDGKQAKMLDVANDGLDTQYTTPYTADCYIREHLAHLINKELYISVEYTPK